MKKYALNKKLKNLTSTINILLIDNDDSVVMIHNLRKKTRELLSLVITTDPFHSQLKKIIKLSNNIRDIDVFFNMFYKSLKPIHKKSLDMIKIKLISKNSRSKQFNKLYLYLDKLNIPTSVKCKDLTLSLDNRSYLEKEPIIMKQKILHKYRIYIKQRLYLLKNDDDKEKIIILTTLKDLLGKINDNYNSLKRLQKFNIEKNLFKEIEKNTIKRNSKYFNKVIKLNNQL